MNRVIVPVRNLAVCEEFLKPLILEKISENLKDEKWIIRRKPKL